MNWLRYEDIREPNSSLTRLRFTQVFALKPNYTRGDIDRVVEMALQDRKHTKARTITYKIDHTYDLFRD